MAGGSGVSTSLPDGRRVYVLTQLTAWLEVSQDWCQPVGGQGQVLELIS